MTHSTLLNSTRLPSGRIFAPLSGVLVAVLIAATPVGAVLAADDAACPHDSNDKQHACMHKHKHRGHHRGERSDAEMQRFRERMQKLALSETQKQEMGSLMGIYQPRMKALRERGQTDRDALFNAVPGAEGYTELADKVSAEAAKTAGELVVLLAELQANAYALLNEEQQAEYLELKQQALGCIRIASSDKGC